MWPKADFRTLSRIEHCSMAPWRGIVLVAATILFFAISAAAQSRVGAAGAMGYATTPSSALGQGPLVGSMPGGTANASCEH